jgi:hypothetical protein
MFWKKKRLAVVPVIEGTAGATDAKPSTKEEELPPKHKNESSKAVKLPGPRPIQGLIEKYITATYKIDDSIVRLFKMVVRKRPNTEKALDCRIYDPQEAEASEVQVKDYTSLDGHTDLILYDGWFDEESKQVELTERKKVNFDVPLLTEAEILQKIEALREPGSSVFFYQNAGSAAGGPLGRGAAIIELNPDYGKKKAKKYIIHTANVVGMDPVAKRNKLYDSDKPKEIAKWVAESHKKRIY